MDCRGEPAGGPTVSEVAWRWQVCPQQVRGCRRAARTEALTLRSAALPADTPDFVPVATGATVMTAPSDRPEPTPDRRPWVASALPVEIELAGAKVRVADNIDGARLTEVLRAMRASAA